MTKAKCTARECCKADLNCAAIPITICHPHTQAIFCTASTLTCVHHPYKHAQKEIGGLSIKIRCSFHSLAVRNALVEPLGKCLFLSKLQSQCVL